MTVVVTDAIYNLLSALHDVQYTLEIVDDTLRRESFSDDESMV